MGLDTEWLSIRIINVTPLLLLPSQTNFLSPRGNLSVNWTAEDRFVHFNTPSDVVFFVHRLMIAFIISHRHQPSRVLHSLRKPPSLGSKWLGHPFILGKSMTPRPFVKFSIFTRDYCPKQRGWPQSSERSIDRSTDRRKSNLFGLCGCILIGNSGGD